MRKLLVALAVLLLLLGLGALWLDSLFEEPAARQIESLSAELDAKVLLCVFAHPDDEVTVAGAIADATARGVRVHVITATRGEQGSTSLAVSGPEELGRIREAELREHTRVLGVDEQIVWHFPDSAVAGQLETLGQLIVLAIDRIQPDAVLTFHPGSGYTNHPDQRAVGLATVRALERSNSEARLVRNVAPRRVMGMFGAATGCHVGAPHRRQRQATRVVDPSVPTRLRPARLEGAAPSAPHLLRRRALSGARGALAAARAGDRLLRVWARSRDLGHFFCHLRGF